MDDTGFFSVQVMHKALALWGLDLTPIASSTDEIAIDIRSNPTKATAYIFNMDSHWYCIRRFKTDPVLRPTPNEAHAFFNLDSLLSKPEYMSSSFLTEYLKQMQNEGYSIFVVSGAFPECAAEPLRYTINSAVPSTSPSPSSTKTQIIDLSQSDSKSEQDKDIQQAIRLSLAEYSKKYDRYQLPSEAIGSTNHTGDENSTEYNADLEAALKLSLDCFSGANQESERLTPTQLRDKRLAYFSAMSPNEK